MYKAWVDYSFMIGAWCFTAGNYAVYFQVINFEGDDLSFIAWPDLGDWGHLGTLFNLFGAIAYNVNTMLFFDTADHDSIMYEYNLVYVISGGLGSILFALGALAEGEHNNWRDCNKETFKKVRVGWRANPQQTLIDTTFASSFTAREPDGGA